ncbi:MAG: hypothetical protein ORO03_01250 [Alphaproteobacteria bacterium]|nr:hypothetical protein [Alphaproteobacteria bacterium]
MSDQIDSGILSSNSKPNATQFTKSEATEALARINHLAKQVKPSTEAPVSGSGNLFQFAALDQTESKGTEFFLPAGDGATQDSPFDDRQGDSAAGEFQAKNGSPAAESDGGDFAGSAAAADDRFQGQPVFPDCLTASTLGDWFRLPPADRRALRLGMPKLNLSKEAVHDDAIFASELHQALKSEPTLRFEINHMISNLHKGAKGRQRSLLWQVLDKCGKKLSPAQRQELREKTSDFASHTRELLTMLRAMGEDEAVAIATWALASPPGRWQAEAPDEDSSAADSVKRILELLHSVHVSTAEMGRRLKRDWYQPSFVELYESTLAKLTAFKLELDRAKSDYQSTEVTVKHAVVAQNLADLMKELKTLSNPTAQQQVERIIAKIDQKPASGWSPTTIDAILSALTEVESVMKKRAEINKKISSTAEAGEIARSKGDRDSAKLALAEQAKLVESDLDQIDIMNGCLNRIDSVVKTEIAEWEKGQKSAARHANLSPEKELELLLRTAEHERDQARSGVEELRQTINALKTRNSYLEQKLANGRSEGDEVVIPSSFEELEVWAQTHLAGKVVVLPRAIRSAKKSEFENIELAYRALLCLRDHQYPMRIEGGSELVEAYRKATQELRLQDENTFPGNRATLQGDTYFVDYYGQRRLLERHLKGSNSRDPRHCFRLYYFWDDETKLIVVGSLPNHLPTEVS